MLQRQQERVKTTQSTTVNYGLPLWDGQEVTSWMTQMNDAMDKIDSAMWENKTGIDNEKEAVENANQAASEANLKLESLNAWQATIENDVDAASNDASKAKGDAAQALQGAANATMEVQALQEIVDSQGDDIERLAGEIKKIIATRKVTFTASIEQLDNKQIQFTYFITLYTTTDNTNGLLVVNGTLDTHINSLLPVSESKLIRLDIDNPVIDVIKDLLTSYGYTADDKIIQSLVTITNPWMAQSSFEITSEIYITYNNLTIIIASNATPGNFRLSNSANYSAIVTKNGNS